MKQPTITEIIHKLEQEQSKQDLDCQHIKYHNAEPKTNPFGEYKCDLKMYRSIRSVRDIDYKKCNSHKHKKCERYLKKHSITTMVIVKPLETTVEFLGEKLDVSLDEKTVLVEGIGIADEKDINYFITKASHSCGLMGYNPMLGDSCGGCDEKNYQKEAMPFVLKELEDKKLIQYITTVS